MGIDFGFDLHESLLTEKLHDFITQLTNEAKEYNQSSEAFEQIDIKIENDDHGYVIWINYLPIAFFYGKWKDSQGQINKRVVYPIEEIGMIERPIFSNFLYCLFAKYLELNELGWLHIFDERTSFININLPRDRPGRVDAIDFCLDYSWRRKEKAFQRSNKRI